MDRWKPRVELTKKEEMVMKRLKRVRALFGFLRLNRHHIFNEAFQEQLEAMYRKTGAGDPPLPPAMLCMVLLLQGYVGASDAEAVEMAVMDLRWQMVLDCVGADEPPFSQGALQRFRNHVRVPRAELDRADLLGIQVGIEAAGPVGARREFGRRGRLESGRDVRIRREDRRHPPDRTEVSARRGHCARGAVVVPVAQEVVLDAEHQAIEATAGAERQSGERIALHLRERPDARHRLSLIEEDRVGRRDDEAAGDALVASTVARALPVQSRRDPRAPGVREGA